MSDEEKDLTKPAFFQNLKNIFAEARASLTEKAEEFGIDLTPLSDEEYAEIRAREKAFIKGEEITKLAEKYAWDARTVLSEKDQWLSHDNADDEIRASVIEVIYWYQFFISGKIQRGLHGILDADGDVDTDEIRDSQSDTNGSIKVALIAIERSLLSWTYLLSAENSSKIRPLIDLLENTKQLTEKKFPNARDFIRPGFDEIEMVM